MKKRTSRNGLARAGIFVLLSALPVAAQIPDNECDPGEEPDVIVGDLFETRRWGSVGNVTAFSVGTISCNIGTCWLKWDNATNEHPVIGQNMYRLKNGRFEQIGQSWLKHGFFALSEQLCSTSCSPTPGDHLGVNCSDPYTAQLNGTQYRLGPRSEVNPNSGSFPFPATNQSQTGDDIFKRIQVENGDLDPALNAGAKYYVEGQYVTADDAAASNQNNNASYRPISVVEDQGEFDISLDDTTVQTLPAIFAWKQEDPAVTLKSVSVPGDGLFYLGARATDLGGGVWHYEYAVHNLNVHRAMGSFSVPIPAEASVTNVEFHDIDYHSGEVLDSADWSASVNQGAGPCAVVWSTDGFAQNPNANALRWGTLYNFRFDADVPPATGIPRIIMFRPGVPSEVVATAPVPNLCDGDSVCDPDEDCVTCPAECVDSCCGDSVCDPDEDCATCPADCGFALDICDNGRDDDCNGLSDCEEDYCCSIHTCGDGDDDGDGFDGCDCDDTNPDVYPGAPQACGPINYDCDDPAWPAPPATSIDDDGDGLAECEGDCDDTDPAVLPGALEVCNGYDDDCDDLIDEDGAGEDTDADGVGNLCDNCPNNWNPNQGDFDSDGIGDACDTCTDSDGDGFGDPGWLPNTCAEDNCAAAYNPDQADMDFGPGFRQWATSATASSEYSTPDYAAMQASGAPENAGTCIDVETNWAPLTGGTDPEWLALEYATPVRPTGVEVWELLGYGDVTRVDLVDTAGGVYTIWSGTETTVCGGAFSPTWAAPPYPVGGVVVHTQSEYWEEIDAVELIGVGPTADGAGDACDVCPLVPDPSQTDTDGDGAGDACDCAPGDSLSRQPAEAQGLMADRVGTDVARFSWPAVAGADDYFVTRGELGSLGPGAYGSCLASGLSGLTHDDGDLPAPHEGYFYLIQGSSTTCGLGSLGRASGFERLNTDPAACSTP